MSDPWDLTAARRQQFREAHAGAKRTRPTKVPTASSISRLLAAAGFERAGFGLPTRFHHDGRPIRTSRPPVPGFQVQAEGARVIVRWRHGRVVNLDAMCRERLSWLARYAKTITEAGWTVEAGEYELTVTSLPSPPSVITAAEE